MAFVKMSSRRTQCEYYENMNSVKHFYQKLGNTYDQHNRPSKNTFKRIVERIQRSHSMDNQRAKNYSRDGPSQKNVNYICASVGEEYKM